MMAMQQLGKLNKGEHVVTYRLTQVHPHLAPVIGELRYLLPFVPCSGEELASLVALRPVRIAWTGKEWVLA